MKLAGLLAAALAEPTLARARDLAAAPASQLDLTGPPALRPFVAAIVAADPDPEAFAGRAHFLQRIETIMESIAEQEGARIPGSRRAALREKAKKEGLTVPANLVEEARALAGC